MNFDPLARHYRWIELVSSGNQLQRCRTEYLGQIPAAKNILIAGEGNGRFLAECLRQFSEAQITVVDASARMLGLARARVQKAGFNPANLQFIHADALNWQPETGVHDLIVTHFFLDCFPEAQLERVIASLAKGSAPGANWLLADFQVPAQGWPRHRARIIIALLYAFFRATTGLPASRLIEPDHFLKRQNFALQARRVSDWGLLRSDRWRRALDCSGGL